MSDERALFHRIGFLRVDGRYIAIERGSTMTETAHNERPTLVLGGTGKTGRRVVARLAARGLPVRVGSRRGQPPFDWGDESTWTPVLQGARAAYIPYPDLVIPGPTEATRAFAELAIEHDVTRLVLLTGRGEDEAQRAEREVQATGADVTVVRCAWFMQIFSEDFLLDSIRAGEVVLPAVDGQLDPFVDADDIADVAVAALTDDRHVGHVYELTSPRLLSFPEAITEIAKASGRDITYVPVSVQDYAAGAAELGAPARARRLPDLPVQQRPRQQPLRHRHRAAGPGPAAPRLHRLRHPHGRHRHMEPAHGPMSVHDVRSPVAEPVRAARIDGDGWTGLVLGAALVAMALVTGLIYTFSVAVMPNLAGADDRTFVTITTFPAALSTSADRSRD